MITDFTACADVNGQFDLTSLFESTTSVGGSFSGDAGVVSGDILGYDPNGSFPMVINITYMVGDASLGSPVEDDGDCYGEDMAVLTIIASPSPSFDLPSVLCDNSDSAVSLFNTYVNNGNLANGEFSIDGLGQGLNTDVTMDMLVGMGAGTYEVTYTETVIGTGGDCVASITEVIEIITGGDASFASIPAQCVSSADVILGSASDAHAVSYTHLRAHET